MKKKHLLFGIMGLYLTVLSVFWLYFGIHSAIATMRMANIFDSGNVVVIDDSAWLMNLLYALCGIADLSRILVGILSLACLIVTATRTRFIALETAMVCMLALNLMFYGVTIGFIVRFYQPVVIYFLSRKWCAYQEQLVDQGIDRKREYFPFVKEFVRYRECK